MSPPVKKEELTAAQEVQAIDTSEPVKPQGGWVSPLNGQVLHTTLGSDVQREVL